MGLRNNRPDRVLKLGAEYTRSTGIYLMAATADAKQYSVLLRPCWETGAAAQRIPMLLLITSSPLLGFVYAAAQAAGGGYFGGDRPGAGLRRRDCAVDGLDKSAAAPAQLRHLTGSDFRHICLHRAMLCRLKAISSRVHTYLINSGSGVAEQIDRKQQHAY